MTTKTSPSSKGMASSSSSPQNLPMSTSPTLQNTTGDHDHTSTFVPVRFSRRSQPMSSLRSSSFADSLERENESTNELQDGELTATTATSGRPAARRVVNISRAIIIPDMKRVERSKRLPEYGPSILFLSGGTAIRELSRKLKYYTHNSIHLITPFDSGGSSAILRKTFNMLSVGDLRNRLVALCDEQSKASNSVPITQLLSHRLHKYDNLLAYEEFHELLLGYHPLIRAISLPMRSILIQHLHWFNNRIKLDTSNKHKNTESVTTQSVDNNEDTTTNPSHVGNDNVDSGIFDFRGASIGNLIIVGCYVEHDYDIVTAIYWVGTLLGVKGKVRPITAANLHLRAHYNDGTCDIGQHKLVKGDKKSSKSLQQQQVDQEERKKIIKIDFVEHLHLQEEDDDEDKSSDAASCHIDMVSSELITSFADVMCFPMGSFFGSVVVNLLPKGVGKAIMQRQCPKIYVPNTGNDPEMYGYTLSECIDMIITTIQNDATRGISSLANGQGDDGTPSGNGNVSDVLNFVLVDTANCEYNIPMDMEIVKERWPTITILDICLVDMSTNQNVCADVVAVESQKAQELDPTKVAEVLITLGS